MRVAGIDWGADQTIFFMVLFVILLVTIVALTRLSPKRKSRRRIDKQQGNRAGEVID